MPAGCLLNNLRSGPGSDAAGTCSRGTSQYPKAHNKSVDKRFITMILLKRKKIPLEKKLRLMKMIMDIFCLLEIVTFHSI